MLDYEPLCQVQTNTKARYAVPGLSCYLVKLVEQAVAHLWRNAAATFLYYYFHLRPQVGEPQRDAAIGGSKLKGIGKQVKEHHFNFLPVGKSLHRGFFACPLI